MKKIPSSVWMFALAGAVVIAVIGFAFWNGSKPAVADAFAQCLSDKGVTMFGAWWCPHCAAQKKLFGDSFQKINYVECSPDGTKNMSQECKDEGVQGYPTWRFADGTTLSGERTFDELGGKAGCTPPTTP